MTRLFKKMFFVLPVFGLMLAQQAYAANNDSSTITVEIPAIANITNVDDLDLGTWSGSGDLSAADDVCIYVNSSGGGYTMEAHGNGAGSAFTLLRISDSATVSYTVKWGESSGLNYSSMSTILSANTPSSTLTGVTMTNAGCSGGTNASFAVQISESELGSKVGVSSEDFSGTLTLTVAAV